MRSTQITTNYPKEIYNKIEIEANLYHVDKSEMCIIIAEEYYRMREQSKKVK